MMSNLKKGVLLFNNEKKNFEMANHMVLLVIQSSPYFGWL
jgi:hypothetical protein